MKNEEREQGKVVILNSPIQQQLMGKITVGGLVVPDLLSQGAAINLSPNLGGLPQDKALICFQQGNGLEINQLDINQLDINQLYSTPAVVTLENQINSLVFLNLKPGASIIFNGYTFKNDTNENTYLTLLGKNYFEVDKQGE